MAAWRNSASISSPCYEEHGYLRLLTCCLVCLLQFASQLCTCIVRRRFKAYYLTCWFSVCGRYPKKSWLVKAIAMPSLSAYFPDPYLHSCQPEYSITFLWLQAKRRNTSRSSTTEHTELSTALTAWSATRHLCEFEAYRKQRDVPYWWVSNGLHKRKVIFVNAWKRAKRR